jgi:hypothetical protein
VEGTRGQHGAGVVQEEFFLPFELIRPYVGTYVTLNVSNFRTECRLSARVPATACMMIP